MDKDMTILLETHMVQRGVHLKLKTSIKEINEHNVIAENGEVIQSDMVIMAIGVIPESAIAQEAGIETGAKGAIKTNDVFETSIKDIYAIGDVAEITHKISQQDVHIPL
ncbi:FAD-dependent oxidoreductase, partial [Enterococcus faecalis]